VANYEDNTMHDFPVTFNSALKSLAIDVTDLRVCNIFTKMRIVIF
jgi:hypothetical protein